MRLRPTLSSHLRLACSGSLVVVLALMLAGCQAAPAPAAATGGTAEAPASSAAEAVEVVSAAAVVVPYQEAVLSIRASGRVEKILVSEGQIVETGQELALVETRDLEQTLAETEAGLKSAQAGLAKAKAGARTEDIAPAKAAVAIAEAGVAAAQQAKAVSEGSIETARADEEAAAAAVTVAQGNLAAAQATLSGAQAALSKLLAGPTVIEIKIAEGQLERAKNELWALQSQRDATRNVLEGQIAAAEQMVRIAELQLEQLKTGPGAQDTAAARAQVAAAQAGVKTAEGQVKQAQAQQKRAAAGVKIAEAQAAQAGAQVESAAAQVLQAQAQLEQLQAGSRPEDVATAEAAVARAEAAASAARNALEDATLRAPFAGTIGGVLVQEGELVTPQTPMIRLGDLTRLQVRTEDLGEGDVTLVREGQKVRVGIDALPNLSIEGTVARVAPYASERRGDKVYDVLIDLKLPAEAGLRWGMSTFVEILVK